MLNIRWQKLGIFMWLSCWQKSLNCSESLLMIVEILLESFKCSCVKLSSALLQIQVNLVPSLTLHAVASSESDLQVFAGYLLGSWKSSPVSNIMAKKKRKPLILNNCSCQVFVRVWGEPLHSGLTVSFAEQSFSTMDRTWFVIPCGLRKYTRRTCFLEVCFHV